jgi:hypothetical protein
LFRTNVSFEKEILKKTAIVKRQFFSFRNFNFRNNTKHECKLVQYFSVLYLVIIQKSIPTLCCNLGQFIAAS